MWVRSRMGAAGMVAVACAVVLAIGVLAGCGSSETTTTAATTETTAAPSESTTTTEVDPYADVRGKFAGEKLVVTAWSGPYAENWASVFIPEFEEITGATVEMIPSWVEIPNKIKAAPADDPPFDVTIGDGSVYWTARDDKLFEPIRWENIPNSKEIFPALMEQTPAAEGYGVPFDGSYAAIIHNPDVEMTKWADFWRPELKQRISLDINFYYSIYAAIFALGMEPRDALTDPAKTDQVFAKMKELAPSVLKWYESGGEFYGLLERGELDAGYYYADTIIGETSERLGLIGAIPTDGQIGYIDYYFVVRGTKHRDLAEVFINYIISAEKQQQWLEKNWSSVSNSNVVLPEGTPPEREQLVAVTNEQWAAWHDYDWDIFFQDWDMWDARWKKEVLGQ
ncbi:MAG: extracellular solute-binding protein [Actinobacteria bacterium]|nr:extracellular solute-binding protein [Actinomycetota bacterium]